MSSVVISGDTSGAITLAAPAVAGTNTITLPANTGTVLTTASTFGGTGPAFRATNNATQNNSASTWTKVLFQVETFDTNNNFASSTFTPTVAGYYQISAAVAHNFGGADGNQISTAIYKNGSSYGLSSLNINVGNPGPNGPQNISDLVYCNGSTDYVEIYCWSNNASPQVTSNTRFSGVLVRSA